MNWKYYLERGEVKEIEPDIEKAKGCLNIADRRLKLVDQNPLDDDNAPVILCELYEALLQTCHAILFTRGFKAYPHEAVTTFLAEVLNKPKESDVFDRYRKQRNLITYYGKTISKEYVATAKEEILALIKELRERYLTRLK